MNIELEEVKAEDIIEEEESEINYSSYEENPQDKNRSQPKSKMAYANEYDRVCASL